MGVVHSIGQVVPFEITDRFGKRPAVLVDFLNLEAQFHNDVTIGHAVAQRFGALIAPLHPTTAIGDAAFLFHCDGRRQHENLGFDTAGINPGAFPEGTGFILEYVGVNHPIQVLEAFPHFSGIGAAAGRVLPPGKEPLECPLVHFIEEIQPGVSLAVIDLGEPVIAKVVGRHCRVPEKGLEHAHRVLWIVLPPVRALGIVAFGCPFLVIGSQRYIGCPRCFQVPGPDVPEQAMVSGSLHVGFTPQRIDTAAGNTHVAEQQLDDGHGADILNAGGVLSPACRLFLFYRSPRRWHRFA